MGDEVAKFDPRTAAEMAADVLRDQVRTLTQERDAELAEADRLRNVCHMLGLENSILREDAKGIIDRECETLAQELADVRAERDRLQSILDQPVVMLFADGRDPTRNERHLAALLSWRQQEATEAKVEAGIVRAELANIREAARAVLGVLRDRLDGTADEHLVDRLQAVGQGGVR